MRELLAQEFLLMRREVDHQQPPARAQHARRLADRARAVVEEVQHLVQDDDVEGIVGQRQVVDVALAHAAIFQARALEPVARQQQHVEREVEAEPALDLAARTVRACGRCRCRDRAASGTACRRARRGSRLRPPRRRRAACGCGPTRRRARGNRPARRRRAPAAPRRAARGRARWSGRRDRAARAARGRPSRRRRCSARRKKAQVPSRKRSTSPASASSLRWREMRGCDWRRMSVRSETVSSASASSASTRRRVSSPAALSAALRASKREAAAGAHEDLTRAAMGAFPLYKDIFIR